MKSHRRFAPPARSLTLVALLVVTVLLAPTGHAQPPECADFRDLPVGGDLGPGPTLTRDGFEFSALEGEVLWIVQTAWGSGLLVAGSGFVVELPAPTSLVELNIVGYSLEPLHITAYDHRRPPIEAEFVPSSAGGDVEPFVVPGLEIVALHLKGGGDVDILVEICIQPEPETPTPSPTRTPPPSPTRTPPPSPTEPPTRTPPPSPTEPPTPTRVPSPTPPGQCDLRLYDTDSYIEGDDLLVITAQVENVGGGRAPPTILRAGSDGWVRDATVRELGRGESVEVRVRLPIPDEAWGQTHTFTVEVDPQDAAGDANRGNNQQREQVDLIADDDGPGWLLFAVLGVTAVAVIVAAGAVLTIRYRVKIRPRREWQEKAEEEEPAEPCQPCTRYCRVSGMEVELTLRKITHLTLVAQDPDSGEKSGEKEVKGQVVDHLNEAVGAHRRRPEPDKLRSLMRPVAGTLLQDIAEWLRPGPVPRDISVAAHLAGGKVTVQFVLYHCRRKGNLTTWEPEDKWKATVKDERDEPVATLRRLDPAEPGVPERVLPELTQRLMRFVEEVSA